MGRTRKGTLVLRNSSGQRQTTTDQALLSLIGGTPGVYNVQTGISAAGTIQGDATVLTGEYCNVTTVGAGAGVKLLTAAAGQRQTIRNGGANTLLVWPFLGDAIGSRGTNISVEIAAGATVTFTAIDTTTWHGSAATFINAPTSAKGGLAVKATDNTGDYVTILTNAAQGQATTVTIPDPGNASANFVLTKGAFSTAGVNTPTGGIAAAGGFAASPSGLHTGGQPAMISTDGTDTTPTGGGGTTTTYMASVFVPANCTVTGVAVFNGSVASGNLAVSLADSSGVPISAAQKPTVAMSGTDSFQRVPFTAPYACLGPATYYVMVQADNGTARLNTHIFGSFNAQKKTSDTFGTFTTMAPAGTFTTATGVFCSLY